MNKVCFTSRWKSPSALRHAALALALLAPACLLPPPEDAAKQSGAPAKVVSGTRFVIWDGDGGGLDGGQSWADCSPKPGCKASLMAAPKKGYKKTGGLAYHAEGKEWNGGGWNWFGWYPENAGTDIRPYDELQLWLRLEAKSKDKAPGRDGFGILLGCSKGGKNSATAQVFKYADGDVYDGKWHKLTIPLADLYVGKEGKEFDPQTAWELRIVTWDPHPRDFTVYMDDVTLVKK